MSVFALFLLTFNALHCPLDVISMFTDFKSKITEGPSGALMVTAFTHSVRFEFCSFMRNQQTETESAVLIEEFGHPSIMDESVTFWVLHTHFDDVGSGNNIRSASMFFHLNVEHSAFSFGLADAYAGR